MSAPDTSKSSRFLVRRGIKQDYERLSKNEGELYYLTDTKELASHKTIYTPRVDGGYFGDYKERSKFDGVNGGEF